MYAFASRRSVDPLMVHTVSMTFHDAGGEVDQLARGLETLDSTLDALCGSMRNLNVQDTGPPNAADTLADAIARLERGLARVSAQARDAAVVVRRFESEEAS